VFLVLYFLLTGLAGSQPEYRDTIALFEPFGLGAFSDVTRYWSADESNNLVAAFEGSVAYNRGLVLALSMLALSVAFWRYSFSEKGISARQLKKDSEIRKKEALAAPNVVSRLPGPNQAASALARLTARTRLEMGMIFKSPAFFVLILLGLTNSGGALWFANELYVTPSVPMTFALILP